MTELLAVNGEPVLSTISIRLTISVRGRLQKTDMPRTSHIMDLRGEFAFMQSDGIGEGQRLTNKVIQE